MGANSDCVLVCLNASKFQAVARRFRTQDFFPAVYAAEFTRTLNAQASHLTDLDDQLIVDHIQILTTINPGYAERYLRMKQVSSRTDILRSVFRRSLMSMEWA